MSDFWIDQRQEDAEFAARERSKMKTFVHAQTGIVIHYNADYSGEAQIYTSEGRTIFGIPAAALMAFSRNAFVEGAINALQSMFNTDK